MERVKQVVKKIAYSHDHAKLAALDRSFLPVLALASSLYKFTLFVRQNLYCFAIFRTHRLPVPVISVGNLTWGGNGKTPMVEFIATWLADSEVSPLILTRGYASGDEVKMLQRHLLGRPIKFGVGANRAAVAHSFFQTHGFIDLRNNFYMQKPCLGFKFCNNLDPEKVGVVVLDDGMQHRSLWRDFEIVMINGLTLFGNLQLVPRGPMRESLDALARAHVAVIHHADLVSGEDLETCESIIRNVKKSLPVFLTRMDPSHFFEVQMIHSAIPLEVLNNAIVLCVTAIASADAFVQIIQKMGALYVDRVDFSDHHKFCERDVEGLKTKVRELEEKFMSKPTIVVTEKDYDRDPKVLGYFPALKVLVLCSKLKFIPYNESTEISFKKLIKEQLKINILGIN